MSLRKKLTLSFLMIVLFSFALIGVFANSILGNQFKSYAVGRLNGSIEDAVERAAMLYSRAGNAWDLMGLEDVGMDLLTEGFILRVSDARGDVVWDAQEHNNGMCMRILESMAQNMRAYNSNFQGGYVETAHPVTVGQTVAGTVYIGYYGPYFYSDADLHFLTSLNRLLLIAAGISLFSCLLLGAYLAKLLARPIAAAVRATGRIAAGDYAERIPARSGTREIVELTGSINSLAASLEGQSRLRKRLTADVAHELRTPLTTLQSHIEAMIDGVWEADAERLSSCREEILRLSKLVDELGTLARYDGEDLALSLARFDLGELARRIATNFEGALREKGVTVNVAGGALEIEADRDKLGQVIVNLLSNALKFTPEGGRIDIEIGETPNEAVLAVRDTGVGIPAEDLPHIFERFYRADVSRSRGTGGFGIGLSIGRAIVRAHGGNIRAQSALGKGSVFTVTLPKKMANR